MRHLSHVVHSPKLILQLLLLLAAAGLIGGAGLRGLLTARSTLHTISSTQLPGLVHLLDAEREITLVKADSYRAVMESMKDRKTGVQEIPRILALVRLSWDNYQEFEASGHRLPHQASLQATVEARFAVLMRTAGTIDALGPHSAEQGRRHRAGEAG
jgi:hypothetical protein